MANPFAQYAAKPVQEPAVEQQSDNPFQRYASKPAPTEQQKVSELGIPLPPVKEPKPIGRLESAGGAFMRGFGSIVASLPKAVGEGAVALANKFGDDPIWGNPEGLTPEDTASYKAGNAIDRWFNRFAVNPEYNEEFTSQLASGAGSMAGFLAGGFAGRAAKVPALVTTMGLGATATGVEGVEDYLATLSDDEQADPEMRENAFALNAALGTSEGLPVSRILNRLDTMSGGGIKAILKEGVKGGLEELTQEVLQSVGQNAIASELLEYDKNRNLFTGTVEAGEVGFTLGFLLNTLAASIGSRRARRGAEPAADEGEIELPDIDPAAEQPIDAIGDVIELPDITAEDIEQAPPAAETAEGTQDQTGPAPGVGGEELAAEPITEEIEPVPEVNYFDNRLKRDIYRNRLQNVADELVEGGGIALVPDLNFVGGESDVRDAQGRPQAPMVRTPSLNPEWFQNLMSDSNYSMSVKKVQNAVTKAIAGDRLGVRQARVIGAMLDNIHGERMDSLAYAREQLNIAREARAKAQLPVADDWLFEEQEYPDDFDGLSRTFTELHDQAKNMDAALADEVEALMESQMDDAAVLDAITKKFEEYNGRKITTSTEAYTQPEGAAEIPGAGAEPIAGIPAAEGIPAGIPAGDQLARAEPVPAERQLAEPVPAQPHPAPVEVPVAKKAPGKKTKVEQEWPLLDKPKYLGKKGVRHENLFNWDEIQKSASKPHYSPGFETEGRTIENDIHQLLLWREGAESDDSALMFAPRGAGRTTKGLLESWRLYNAGIRALYDWVKNNPDKWQAYKDRQKIVKTLKAGDKVAVPYGNSGGVIKRKNKKNWSIIWDLNSDKLLLSPSVLRPPTDILAETTATEELKLEAQTEDGATSQDRRKKKQPGRKVERRLKGREERRKAWAYRKDVEEMTESERKAAIEELRHDAMINDLTGLGSRLAWEQVEKKAFIAAIDADSLKYVNDTLGNKAGDELLVKIGKALKSEFGKDAYHISGDEFWIHSDSMDDLVISLGAVQDKLKTESATGPGGTITGLGFSYGVAETENVADRKMKTDKKTRQKEGLRVERGERPAGVVLKGEKAEKPAKKEKTLTVYHGSPFIFSKFDMSKIGTGEGAQAFGYGLYLAENKNVAADYQEKLGYKDIVRQFRSELPDDAEIEDIEGMLDDGGEFQPQIESVLIALRNDDWLGFDYPSQAITAAFKDIENFDPSPALIDAVKNYGKVYTVNLSEKDVDNMLDWDKQMDQQPKNVQAQFRDASGSFGRFDKLKGMQIYQRMANEQGGGKAASDLLLSLGVKGIKYLDQVSRKAGEGSRNLVIFDDSIVEIQEERKPEKRVSKKKTDLAGKVDEEAQAKKDAEVAAKKEQAKKEEAAEKYAGPPDLLTGGELEPDLFAPSKKETKKAVDEAAHEAATSPKNGKPEPTEGQKEAGNYKKGVLDSSVLPWLKGLKIMIENPAGSKRRPEWKAMQHHYGYFQSTEAYDADEVDVFLGPDLAQEPELVHVVDQVHPDTGKPDEHKVMLGFKDEAAAKSAYMANYQKGWKGFSRIQSYLYADFKDKLTSGFFKNSTPARKFELPVQVKKRIPVKTKTLEEEATTKFNNIVGRLNQLRQKSKILDNDIGQIDTYDHVIKLLDGPAKNIQNIIASYESLTDGRGIASVYSALQSMRRDIQTNNINRNWIPKAEPAKAKKPAKRAKPEEKHTEYNGLNISYEVETEDTGETFTVTVDAGVAMREVDTRLTALKALRDCL